MPSRRNSSLRRNWNQRRNSGWKRTAQSSSAATACDCFRHVAETGSLAEAARRMGLSYRRAWGKISEIETNLGVRLVETEVGGAGGGSTHLTPVGRARRISVRAVRGAAPRRKFAGFSWSCSAKRSNSFCLRYAMVSITLPGRAQMKKFRLGMLMIALLMSFGLDRLRQR